MTLAETVRDIRHRLAELVAEHGRWNGLVDSEANRLILQALSTELAAAHQRERIVVEAYGRQQLAQRELEALYQAMTERAQQAEANASALRQALMDIEKMGVTSGYSKAACAIVARRALGGKKDER
jgi:predicted amidohydrolase YtcJ